MYRVFLVDDEPLICKGLRETVEWDSLGLEIAGEAHNGVEAMELIAATHPHILITDIRMPGMDGISLIKAIREQDLNIRIIILSGYSDYHFLKEAIRLGVDGYLLKPIDTDELISNLCNLVTVIEKEQLQTSRLYQGLELLRTNTLNRLVTGEIGRGEFNEKAAFLDISLDAEHYLCAVCAPVPAAEEAELGADPGVAIAIQRACHPFTVGNCITFVDNKNHLVFIFFGSREEDVAASAKAALERVIKQTQESVGVTVAVRSGVMVHALTEVARSYAAAAEGFEHEKEPLEGDPLDGRWKCVVNRTVAYIAAHYHEALSLKQIACECGINTSYLGQVFRKSTGDSFTNYVNGYRIQKARELLASTTLKVYEVSERVGFTDYHYFLKIFKKVTGNVPTDTRSDNFYHKT
ncbi:MAG: response regulator transcription factor [Candidatus Limiplasma sp.]|nr:response regulator transcription factor [Candidatus Limiplasma sp.]